MEMATRSHLLLIFAFNNIIFTSSEFTSEEFKVKVRPKKRTPKKSYTLNDGHEIPMVALGTSLGHTSDGTRVLPEKNSSKVAQAVEWALEIGYRHIETAAVYQVEEQVGRGVRNFLQKSGHDRKEILITTQLWNDAHEKNEVIPALNKSLTELQMDYVDLYLMHFPMAYKKDGNISLTDYLVTWDSMEEAKRLGLAKSIGVSNFNLTQLERLWDYSIIKPSVLQTTVNPSMSQVSLLQWCKDHGVVVMAYSPFGFVLTRSALAPPPKPSHAFFKMLVKKYKRKVPQILLRYLLDLNLVVVPRALSKERILENYNIFDFNLTNSEMEWIKKFNCNCTPDTMTEWWDHPHFPYKKKLSFATQEDLENYPNMFNIDIP